MIIKTNPNLEILDPISGQVRDQGTGEVYSLSTEALQLIAFFASGKEVGSRLGKLRTLIESEDQDLVKSFVKDLISRGILLDSACSSKRKMSCIRVSDHALVEKPHLTLLSVPVASLETEYPYQLAFMGIPFDLGSTGYPGSRYGPNRLRELSGSGMDYRARTSDLSCVGWFSENRIKLCEGLKLIDIGDVIHHVGEPFSSFFARASNCIGQILKRKAVPISIGGDHSCLHPIITTFSRFTQKKAHLIVFDAHTDLAEYDRSISHNHGNVVSRIMEEKLVSKVTHIGLRGMIGKPLSKKGYQAIYANQCRSVESIMKLLRLEQDDDVYISFDVDVIDPSQAPGTGTPVPGGLDINTVVECISRLIRSNNVVGFDIVEYNPMRDINDSTGNMIMYALPQILHAFTQKFDSPEK